MNAERETSEAQAARTSVGAEAKWRALSEHWPGYVMCLDVEDRLLWLTRDTAVIDAKRDVGRSIFEFLLPDEAAAARAAFDEARATGLAVTTRRWFNIKGARRHYETRTISLGKGSSAQLMLAITEVTAEVEIAASEERFRAMIEKSSEGISLRDADGKLLYMSPGGMVLLGLPPGATVPVPEIHPDDVGLEAEGLRWLNEHRGESRATEYRLKHGDGTWHYFESVGTNLLQEPAVGAIVGNFRDVTERKRVEEELMLQARVLESMKEAVVATDERGVICFANAALDASFGYVRGELVGQHVRILEALPADESSRRVAQIIAQIEATGSWRGDCPNRRKDGSTFTSEISVTALTVNGKRLMVSVQEDVTERRAIQSRMLVSARMASVGTLAAGVAHEINNPLAYVTANLDMIAEELTTVAGALPPGTLDEITEMVVQACEGAARVCKIVRGLKTFSRADQDIPAVLDVRKVIEQAINLSFNEVRHRARLVRDYHDVPLVEADEARLCQVFVILLVNAAQATLAGRADINEIRVCTSRDEGGRAIVEVRDTGVGIPRELLGHVFDPFFTTKPIGQGTGLGLSICHGIVTGLGGEVSVTSTPGQGSVFRVALPPAPVMHTPAERSPTDAPAATARGRILVVDDDRSVLAAVARVLRGHDVRTVDTGRAALDLIVAGERFDVILCDLMMPEMTGMDLHRELLDVAPDAVDRIVFMTGGAFTPDAKELLDRVPNETVDKPFDTRSVRAVVQRFLRR